MEKINKKKVSQLPEATTIEGFYALGTDNNNNSVKVPIDLLKGNKGDTGEKGDKGEEGNNVAYKTIFNVSTYNNKYDYEDNTSARMAVPQTLREGGQIITYKLKSGKWVTEQYSEPNVNTWATLTNWEDIGNTENTVYSLNNSVSKNLDYSANIVTGLTWIQLDGMYNPNGESTVAMISKLKVAKGVLKISGVKGGSHPNEATFLRLHIYNGAGVRVAYHDLTSLPASVNIPIKDAYVSMTIKSVYQGATVYEITNTVLELSEGDTFFTDGKISLNVSALNDLPITSSILQGVKWTNNQYDKGGSTGSLHGYSCTDFRPIIGGKTLIIKNSAAWAGSFYDAEKNFISIISLNAPGLLSIKTSKLVAFVRLNTSTSNITNNFSAEYGENTDILEGKKVAVFSTSIGAGFPKADYNNTSPQNMWSHFNMLVTDLGGTIINKSVAGGTIGDYNANKALTNVNGVVNLWTDILDKIGTKEEPDYYIFDLHVNDQSLNPDPIKPENWDLSSLDKTTFIGAYNLVLSEIFKKNKSSKIILITHFSNDSINANGESLFTNVNNAVIAIGEYWGIPVVKLHNAMRWFKRHGIDTIKYNCDDGIHPASHNDPSSVRILADTLTPLITPYFV